MKKQDVQSSEKVTEISDNTSNKSEDEIKNLDLINEDNTNLKTEENLISKEQKEINSENTNDDHEKLEGKYFIYVINSVR